MAESDANEALPRQTFTMFPIVGKSKVKTDAIDASLIRRKKNISGKLCENVGLARHPNVLVGRSGREGGGAVKVASTASE